MRGAPIGAARPLLGGVVGGRLFKRPIVAAVAGIGVWLASCAIFDASPAHAAEPSSKATKAATGRAARDEALRAIPRDKLAAQARQRVAEVIDHPSLFRRLPVQVVDCDPELFHYLVRNPEVIVNIWQLMGLTQVTMDHSDGIYRCADGEGTTAAAEFVYQDHDTHILYAEGIYDGPLLPRPVRGKCVVVLKTATVCETNGRYYVTARLDTFLRVDNAGVELVAKLIQGWVGKTVDHNFAETIGFLGSVSRTAETNPQGMRRLAAKLNKIDDAQRHELVRLSDQVAGKMAANRTTARTAATGGLVRPASAAQAPVAAAPMVVASDGSASVHSEPEVLRVQQVAE